MRREDDLLTAYVDGVAELDGSERQRVEAKLRDDGELRDEADATRDVLTELRALPHEGVEPDWGKLELAIRDAVGPDVPVRPWRRWRWLVPICALATTTAIALAWLHHPQAAELPRQVAKTLIAPAQAAEPAALATSLWLDGQVVDVGDLDDDNALPDDNLDSGGDVVATDDVGAILPSDDLGWVDALDDSALDRVETFLAGKKS